MLHIILKQCVFPATTPWVFLTDKIFYFKKKIKYEKSYIIYSS